MSQKYCLNSWDFDFIGSLGWRGLVLLMVVVVELLAVLTVMSLTLFSGVLGLWLGLADEDESVVLQLLDLLLSEVTDLRLGIRALTLLLSHLLSLLLSVLGLVLAALPLVLSFSALPVSLVLSSSSAAVVVASLLVVSSLSFSGLLILGFGLDQRSCMLFHCNLWRLFDLLSCHNWSWSLNLGLRH